MVDEAAISVQPRKLHRRDWTNVSTQLRTFYDDLVKMYEPDTAEFFDRVIIIAERAREVN